jgi:hypothetical protein
MCKLCCHDMACLVTHDRCVRPSCLERKLVSLGVQDSRPDHSNSILLTCGVPASSINILL